MPVFQQVSMRGQDRFFSNILKGNAQVIRPPQEALGLLDRIECLRPRPFRGLGIRHPPAGLLACPSSSILACRRAGTLDCWIASILALWMAGFLDIWHSGILAFQQCLLGLYFFGGAQDCAAT